MVKKEKQEILEILEEHINSEQEEKQVAVRVMVKTEKQEIQEIVVGQKRCARTEDQTASTRTSASPEQMIPAGGTRRSKRAKVAPTRYAPVVEEESWESSPFASGFATRKTGLTSAARHQLVEHEEMVLSSEEEESENESSSLELVDTIQKFVSSNEEIENDSSSLVHLDAIQHTTLENPIRSEQEETHTVEKEKETQEIICQKRHARTEEDTANTRTSASPEQMIPASGTRRSKRVKVAPTRYAPVAEEESWESSPLDSSGVATRKTALTAAVRHQQVPHEEMAFSSEEEESENESSSSVHVDAIQQSSGNKRKRSAPNHSFDDRFNDLKAFKAKYGHCDVSRGEDASLGQWCIRLRVSYNKMQNNQKPNIKLSDEQIQRLNDAGFKWSLQKAKSGFDDRFNDLMAFKAKYGHCNVSKRGENASLGSWCSLLRGSHNKMQNNQTPNMKLSDEQIQRLNDAGFNWSVGRTAVSAFDERFNDLMAFKAKYGNCDVSHRGEDASLGRWCTHVRGSYKKMQNNQTPNMKLSDAQIQRLNDAGFKWSLVRKVGSAFDEHFNDLMVFKAKYGNCDVPRCGDDPSLGSWCSHLRGSYKKMQNHQKPKINLSDEQIQRLNDAGFKWSLQKTKLGGL
jgi:hypothetical protein